MEDLRGGEIEKFLSENESKFSKAYYEVINKKDISKLSERSFYHFFLFIASQFVRTPALRLEFENVLSKAYDKMYSKLANDFMKKKGSKLAGHVRLSPDPEAVKLMHAQMILKGVPRFAQILANRKWSIVENHHDIPLWTSDNPLVLHNQLDLGPYMGNLGLLSPGIEIHFPLTKNLRLFSFDSRTHVLRTSTMGMFERLHVIHENMLQLRYSSRFIYASSNNDFDRARIFLSDYPQFRSERQHMNVC